MAKLADAADLKSAGRKAVGVQVPLRAPDNKGAGLNLETWCCATAIFNLLTRLEETFLKLDIQML